MAKVTVHFHSRGESGNIYAILAKVSAALLKARRINEYNELRDAVTSSHSYEEALKRIREKINLIDDDGEY